MCFQNPSSTSAGTSDGYSSSVPTVIWPPQSSSARRFKSSILSSGLFFCRTSLALGFVTLALGFAALRFATLGFATCYLPERPAALVRACPAQPKISANPTRGWVGFLLGTTVEVKSSNPRLSAQIRGKLLPFGFPC